MRVCVCMSSPFIPSRLPQIEYVETVLLSVSCNISIQYHRTVDVVGRIVTRHDGEEAVAARERLIFFF